METETEAQHSDKRGEGDVWVKKCDLLKRKCEEYEQMNETLLAQTRKIRRIIEQTEKEKSFLIKRLEQFEVLDEIPRNKFSLDSNMLTEIATDEKALLVTAVKIQAELNSELVRMKPPQWETAENDSKCLVVSSNAHHRNGATGSVSPVNHPPSTSTSSQGHVTITTPLQSPVASVITTPSSLVPASVPLTTGSAAVKGKKKAPQKPALAPVKRKAQSKKKPDADPNAPKKPSNAFFWFCQEKRAFLQEQFRGEGMSGQHDLTKALAKLWSETDSEHKKKYYHKYTADKARYDKEMKEYTAQAKQSTPLLDPESSNDSFTM